MTTLPVAVARKCFMQSNSRTSLTSVPHDVRVEIKQCCSSMCTMIRLYDCVCCCHPSVVICRIEIFRYSLAFGWKMSELIACKMFVFRINWHVILHRRNIFDTLKQSSFTRRNDVNEKYRKERLPRNVNDTRTRTFTAELKDDVERWVANVCMWKSNAWDGREKKPWNANEGNKTNTRVEKSDDYSPGLNEIWDGRSTPIVSL